jgi:hypothetical protein
VPNKYSHAAFGGSRWRREELYVTLNKENNF